MIDRHAALRPDSTFDYVRQVFVAAPARLHGIVPYINEDLLGFVAMVALLGLLAGVGPRWSLTTGRRIAISAGSLLVLVLSGSRTSLFILVFGLLVLAVLDARSPIVRVVLVLLAAIAVLVLPALQTVVLEHVRRGQSQQSFTTLTGRTTTWTDALAVWRQQPFIGYGYYAGHRFLGFSADRNLSNLDNMYIETLVDTGLIGLFTLVLFLVKGCSRLVRSAWSRTRSLSIAVVSAAIIGAAFNPSLQGPGVVCILAAGLLLAPWAPAARGRTQRAVGRGSGARPSEGGEHDSPDRRARAVR